MRCDPIDDAAVLKAANRVWLDGTYPTGRSVTRELDWRWCESTVSAALSRLRAAGRLATEPPATKLTPETLATRAREVREVRFEGAKKPAGKQPRTLAQSLASDYWTPQRRRMYKGAT